MKRETRSVRCSVRFGVFYERGERGGEEKLARREGFYVGAYALPCIGAGGFRGAKFSGREIKERCGHAFAAAADGCKIDCLARFQKLRVNGSAGRDDTHHFAPHKLLGLGGRFRLLADGYA